MADLLEARCGCEDCEAAVSPGAYLASLLDYAVKHVTNNGAKIDLDFLEKRFCQPFTELPVDCEATDKRVHQVRLAVEVLRAYVGRRPLGEPARELELSNAESDYRLATYARLLTLLGTTYEEIRLARHALPANRSAMADRLGIDLTPSAVAPREDELDQLFLDATLPAADKRALTERSLERLFGLGDTGRDPLSEGVKYGDEQEQILRWNFDGAYWDRNTDSSGFIYVKLFKIAIDAYAVHVFNDKDLTKVVASGEGKTPSGPVRIVPENGSGLSGVVEIDYKADDTDISISVVPLILGWRLSHLRTLWNQEDWPALAPDPDAQQLPPLIDPQVISLADLYSARPGEATFDLWLARSKSLDTERKDLKSAREAAATELAGLEIIIAKALSVDQPVTVADLDTLAQAQQQGERIEQRLQRFGLSSPAFAFLISLLALARAGQTIIDDEWEVLYDTLRFARKQLQFGVWRTEEKSSHLTLSPAFFRLGDQDTAPEQATSLTTPLWLSTRASRRAWIDILEARVAQEAAITSGLDDAISSVEETTLPILRDALLGAADVEGNSLQDRAEWLTKRLLIDFSMSGSQITTRIAQAIETIQELIFSLRTGQLAQDTVSEFAPLASICATAHGNERIDLFGRGEDDTLWHRVWQGHWRSWRSLGPLPGAGVGFRPSDPMGLTRADGGIDLFVRGSDRVVWYRKYDQVWSEWSRIDDDLQLVGNLAVAHSVPDHFNVFALRISDLQLMQRDFDGSKWTPWNATGATSSRIPAASSSAPDRIDLILGRPSPDLFKPLHRRQEGGIWQDTPLDNVLFADPALASMDVDRLDLFQNFAGHLWQKSLSGAWQPWVDLDAALPVGTQKLKGTPSVYSNTVGTLDVFALREGFAESNVVRRHLEAGAWSNWETLPSDHLELTAPDFESEWEWIGSYTTFRSAMFVRLYPENLLLPSLITHQTPAFRTMVDKTRPTKRLTLNQACTLAREYSRYLSDVTWLEITATCQVLTEFEQNLPCKTAATISKNLLYMFGRSPSGRVYWSAFDPKDRSGYAQTFWDKVPLTAKEDDAATPKVMNIIGALPWLDSHLNQNHIYLFLDVEESGARKLKCAKFDLTHFDDNPWQAELIELSVSDLPRNNWGLPPLTPPAQVTSLTIVPVQSDSVANAPRLAVHQFSTSYLFMRPLNPTGDGWADGDWKSYQIEPQYNYPPSMIAEKVDKLEAALSVAGVTWVVYRHNQTVRVYAQAPGLSGASAFDDPSHFRGALPGESVGPTIFVFYEEDGQMLYREFKKGPAPGGNYPITGPAFITSLGLTPLARHSGSFQPTFFVVPAKGSHTYAHKIQAVSGELIGTSKFDVVPVMLTGTNIPVGESMSSLQSRRFIVKKVYEQNKGASAAILTYLAEAYRLVPQQLGLNMQSSGEYVAALDWFMTVYDYRAPEGERYIDYGLAIDAGLPETPIYTQPENWLLDPLNPHSVALTRRYAYTRFAIASIIRCLNEFADSEFTTDTGESLVRARRLYTTALDLSDVPELRQRAGVCDALIAALKIQPGMLVPPEVAAALGEIADELTEGKVGSTSFGLITLEKMKTLAMSTKNLAAIVPELNNMKAKALKLVPVPIKTGAAVSERATTMAQAYTSLIADPAIEKTVKLAGDLAIAEAAVWMDKL